MSAAQRVVHRKPRMGIAFVACLALSLALMAAQIAMSLPSGAREPGAMPPDGANLVEMLARQDFEPLGQAVPAYASISAAGLDVDPWAHSTAEIQAGPDGSLSMGVRLSRHVPAPLPSAPSKPQPFWIATTLPHGQIHWDGKTLRLAGFSPGARYLVPLELWRRASSGNLLRKADLVDDCADQCALAIGDPAPAGEPARRGSPLSDLSRRIPASLPLLLWAAFAIWLRAAPLPMRWLRVALGLRARAPMPVRQPPVG